MVIKNLYIHSQFLKKNGKTNFIYRHYSYTIFTQRANKTARNMVSVGTQTIQACNRITVSKSMLRNSINEILNKLQCSLVLISILSTHLFLLILQHLHLNLIHVSLYLPFWCSSYPFPTSSSPGREREVRKDSKRDTERKIERQGWERENHRETKVIMVAAYNYMISVPW